MEKLGKYEIIAEIGRGAMGAVYKARDPLIGRVLALKTITSGLSTQANSLERFYQEARSAGALQHPNIVTIYELGHEQNTPFIAMEFVEGASLDHLIEKAQSLPLSVKLGYIVQVCEALSYAHRHRVVHRDIKPGNIMVTKEGAVKIVDFGIARLTDVSLTQQNIMIGSRAYMSPQLYKGERADARADIWAVGVTLYELLAGKRPFLGDSEAELMFHIMSDEPPALQSEAGDCPAELTRIVQKMLAKSADDRYQSMDEVLRDIEPFWRTGQQATVAGLLADSQQLLSANDLQRAQGLLRKALQIDVGNTQAKSLLEKVSAELRRSLMLPKLNEHLDRGRGFLSAGKLREARAELDAALGLDSRHEPAKKLFLELEAANAKAQEVEQKLRLTKQRLAEGALTEAAAALGKALDLDSANAQAQELRRQIEEERARREKRLKLSEVLHHARTLWTALNYEECLKVLSEAQRDFPREPELLKLQEMARHDLEDLKKQRQLGEVRKLLGQREFTQARKIIDALGKSNPHDSAVTNLQTLAIDGEKEQQKALRFDAQLSELRALLGKGKFAEAVNKGDVLLREYPDEFELKELVGYARSEAAQQDQLLKEQNREKEIRELLANELFPEAETVAKRAILEFPRLDVFRKLAEEAGQKKYLQEQRERGRQEMERRIAEIKGMIKQGQDSDAINRAQQTLGKFGPDPNVTQLLQVASSQQAERQKKENQDRQIAASQTLVDVGNFAGATQLLNQAMAKQIVERSDPRVQKQLRTIEQLAKTAKSSPDVLPADEFSATMVGQQPTGTAAKPLRRERAGNADGSAGGSATPTRGVPVNRADELFAAPLAPIEQPSTPVARRPLIPPEVMVQIGVNIRKPAVLGGIGAALLVVLIVAGIAGRSKGPSANERKIYDHAQELWNDHRLDASEQIWRQVEQSHGSYAREAASQIGQIEDKREKEKRLFSEGERLLKEEKNYAGAVSAFNDVITMGLWLSDNARRELAVAQTFLSDTDVHAEEKLFFDQGKAFYDAGQFDKARKAFQSALDLKVSDSTLRSTAESYLKKMRQTLDAKNLYEAALTAIRDENWGEAQQQLQDVVDRKVALSKDAKERLSAVAAEQKAQNTFHKSLSAGAYKTARSQLDAMKQYPKTSGTLLKELQGAQQAQSKAFKSRADGMQTAGDADGLERLRSDVRTFGDRVEDPELVGWARNLDKWLADTAQQLRAEQGDTAAFDAAVAEFEAAKEKGDLSQLGHEVNDKFQKIAKGSGAFRARAQAYVDNIIPAAMQQLTATGGPRRVIVPAIECAGGGGGAVAAEAKNVKCEQLDADAALQWIDVPVVEFPTGAGAAAKLPYTLKLIVSVDASGKVKVEKDGNADKEFLKKAKDASKNWTATVPKAGGKAVSVSFPLAITFQK